MGRVANEPTYSSSKGLRSRGYPRGIDECESVLTRGWTSWIQVLLEFQRDWTRHEIYAARAIVEAHGGGHVIELAYVRGMIRLG